MHLVEPLKRVPALVPSYQILYSVLRVVRRQDALAAPESILAFELLVDFYFGIARRRDERNEKPHGCPLARTDGATLPDAVCAVGWCHRSVDAVLFAPLRPLPQAERMAC